MEQAIKSRVDELLAQAELAADESANGLMDRGDLLHFLSEFIQTTRVLVKECEDLERQRDASTSRLERKPQLVQRDLINSTAVTRRDIAQVY